jgi:hypothetical protein
MAQVFSDDFGKAIVDRPCLGVIKAKMVSNLRETAIAGGWASDC